MILFCFILVYKCCDTFSFSPDENLRVSNRGAVLSVHLVLPLVKFQHMPYTACLTLTFQVSTTDS